MLLEGNIISKYEFSSLSGCLEEHYEEEHGEEGNDIFHFIWEQYMIIHFLLHA